MALPFGRACAHCERPQDSDLRGRADDAYALAEKAKTDSDVFIATYGKTTSAEIEEAYQAGKAVYVKKGLILGELRKRNSATSHFFHILSSNIYQSISCDSDEWLTYSYNYTPASHASTHASGGSDPITPESIGAATKQDVDNAGYEKKGIITRTYMNASGWSGDTYSFESIYPSSEYDIEIELDGTYLVENEYDAWCEAKIAGFPDENKVVAVGKIPTIDIPIIVKKVER